MTADQINFAILDANGSPLEFRLATGQRVIVAHSQSVFIRGRDVLVLHRAESDSNSLTGYDVFDCGAVLSISIVGQLPPPLPGEEPAPILSPGVGALAWGESLLAVLACVVICGRVAKLGYDYYISLRSAMSIGDAWVIGWWSVLIGIELIILFSIVRFYGHRVYPLPLHYALGYRLPRARWLRACTGFVWLAHGALGVWAFSELGHLFSNVSRLWEGPMYWVILVLDAIFVFAGAHGSMLFLLLAAKSFGASQDAIRRLWRFRVLVDLLIVMITLGLLHQATIAQWFEPSQRRRPYGY